MQRRCFTVMMSRAKIAQQQYQKHSLFQNSSFLNSTSLATYSTWAMKRQRPRPTNSTNTTKSAVHTTKVKNLIESSRSGEALDYIMDCVSQSFKFELTPELFNTLIDALIREKRLESMATLIHNFGHILSLIQITKIMQCMSQNEGLHLCLSSVERLKEMGVKLDCYVYNVLINGFIHADKFSEAKEMLTTMEENGVPPNTAVYNSILNGCKIHKRTMDAIMIFDQMKAQEVPVDKRTASIMIGIYSTLGGEYLENAIDLFSDDLESGASDLHVFTAMVKALGDNKRGVALERVVNLLKSKNTQIDEVLATAVMNAYIQNQKLDAAVEMFNSIPKPNITTVNTMLTGYVKMGDLISASRFIKDYQTKYGLSPDSFAYATLLSGLVQANDMRRATQLFAGLLKEKVPPTMHMYSSMMHGYNKTKQFDKAAALYNSILERGAKPDQAIYLNHINTLCGLNQPQEAEKLLSHLTETRTQKSGYTAILQYYITQKDKQQTERISKVMKRAGLFDRFAVEIVKGERRQSRKPFTNHKATKPAVETGKGEKRQSRKQFTNHKATKSATKTQH